jgi:hypothetical protein
MRVKVTHLPSKIRLFSKYFNKYFNTEGRPQFREALINGVLRGLRPLGVSDP